MSSSDRRRAWRKPPPLTDDELAGALSDVPPIMTVDEAARFLRISKSTLYSRVSQGRYRDAVRRGKPMVFFRDRLARALFRD